MLPNVKKVPLKPHTEYKKEKETYTEYRINFDVEKNCKAVCRVGIPKSGKKKYPLFIVLQGHSTGMHISWGEKKYKDDNPSEGDRDFAVQVLNRGYAVLSLEQRGMGERRTDIVWNKNYDGKPRCHATAMNSLLLGRNLVGDRVFDVQRAIDLAISLFPEIDTERIAVTGNSGGGTTAFYAACIDERIKVAMPSCSFCSFVSSIGAMPHCECNYVPGMAKYADMGDLALLIAPRKLVIINGKEDVIFPHSGVLSAFDTVKKIYRSAGVPDNCIMTTGDGGHRYYKDKAWKAFNMITGGEYEE